MKAVIQLDVPEWQIGREVTVYFPDTMMKHGKCELLKEQEKKHITLHKKHVVTWNRNDTFSMRNLYEAICEELLTEGELFIARTDDHEKVEFVFYVAEGR